MAVNERAPRHVTANNMVLEIWTLIRWWEILECSVLKKNIFSQRTFTVSSRPKHACFWPHRHVENMQTSYRQASVKLGFEPQIRRFPTVLTLVQRLSLWNNGFESASSWAALLIFNLPPLHDGGRSSWSVHLRSSGCEQRGGAGVSSWARPASISGWLCDIDYLPGVWLRQLLGSWHTAAFYSIEPRLMTSLLSD